MQLIRDSIKIHFYDQTRAAFYISLHCHKSNIIKFQWTISQSVSLSWNFGDFLIPRVKFKKLQLFSRCWLFASQSYNMAGCEAIYSSPVSSTHQNHLNRYSSAEQRNLK